MNWFDKIVSKIGLDKIAHMFGIAFVCVIMALIFWKTTPELISWAYAFIGFFCGFVVAIFKEVFDFTSDKPFDMKDIGWGMIGNFIAFIIMGLVL